MNCNPKDEKKDPMDEKVPVVKKSVYSLLIKRVLDILISSIALIILSPLMLAIFFLELFIHGHPIFYKSKRPGKGEKLFSIYKFRTMTNKTDQDGKLLPDRERVTKLGRFLRRTSLDEIPEFLNVLKGDMSIIGPRPLLVKYLPLYSKRYKYRHKVKPGLFCARVHSDNTPLTWRIQFENDIYYVENISFFLDIRMAIGLVKELIRGSAERTNGTREEFDGNI